MYCKKCGSPIPDDSRFCNYCGTSVSPVVQQPTVPQSSMANQQAPQNPMANQQAPQNPMANQQVPQNPMANQQVPQSQFFQQANPQPPAPKKKKKKTGLIILILVLVVLLAAGAVGAMFLLNRDKKDETDEFENVNKVVTEFYNASNQCDADLMLNLVPKAYQDYFMEEYDLDNSSLKKAVQDYLEDNLETLEEVHYGNNIETNVTVNSIQELNKSDIDDMNSWHNEANIPLKVEACYACKLVVNTKGDNKDDTFEKNQTIIKVDGKWYNNSAIEIVSLAVAKDD